MKNKVLFSLFLLCLIGNVSLSYAQENAKTTFVVKGTFIDSLTNEGEPYATIKIVEKKTPSKAVKMAVTSGNGKFRETMTALPGNYLITISSIGKRTITKEFRLNAGEKSVDLGNLYTSEATNELKGVEIVAQKPLVKVEVDKLSYNMEDDPDSKVNNVLEMLRKVPLVTVDGEDNIKVKGKSNFKVHVNGKPNTMMSNNPKDVLKNMPASNIKYIEVVTAPGAKYDAEGIGGILNIVTVDRKLQGYTVSLNSRLDNYRWGSGFYGAMQKGKLTLSASYNYSTMGNPQQTSESFRENLVSDEEKYLESFGSSKSNGSFQYGNIEASYDIDTLSLLSFGFGTYGGGNDNNGAQSVTMYNADRQQVVYGYKGNSISDNSWYSYSGNIDYQKISAKNKQRIFTLSYRLNANPSKNNYNNSYSDFTPLDKKQEIVQKFLLFNSRSDGRSNTLEHTFQVDYTTPFGKYHTLETGVKYILRSNTSDNKYYEAEGVSDSYKYNEKRSSDYRHQNNIWAAYLGYKYQYKNFTLKPGVRYEYTNENVNYIVGPGVDFKTNYNNIVPTMLLGFKVGEMQNLRFNYNMRISRPNIFNLNPYFNNSNPMAISQGNPSLKSEKSHNFDISYGYFGSSFDINISAIHSFGNDGIQRVSRLITQRGGEQMGDYFIPEGAMYSTYKNIGKSRSTGMFLYTGINPTPKLRFYFDFYGNYVDIKSHQQGLHNYGWEGFFSGNVQWTLPLDFRFGCYGSYGTPSVGLQSKGTSYYDYSLNLNRSFLKEKRLSIGIFATNLFNKNQVFTSELKGSNFLSTNISRVPTRRFGITLSYRFGEMNSQVKKAMRTIVNDDVKGSGDSGGGKGGSK